jgi:hypothetical protein
VTEGSQTIPLTGTIDVADAPLTGAGSNVSGSSFTTLSNVLVGAFTDGNTLETSPANFQALIDWGDGTSSAGAISYSAGVFTVTGSHTYADAGSFTVTTTVLDEGGASTTFTSTATLSGSVTAAAQPVTATQGVATGLVPVATFTATDHGPFTASIDWGDGHQSTGVVSVNDTGGYTVTGTNTYALAGAFPVTVRLSDNGVLKAVVTGPATVASAALTGIGLPIAAAQGVALSNVAVARFTDASPGPTRAPTRRPATGATATGARTPPRRPLARSCPRRAGPSPSPAATPICAPVPTRSPSPSTGPTARSVWSPPPSSAARPRRSARSPTPGGRRRAAPR